MKQDLNKYLPREPRDIIKNICWFYVEKKGLNIVIEIRKNGQYITTKQIIFPYHKIEKAVKDYKLAVKKQSKNIN